MATTAPDRWTARPSGVSLPKAKCVRTCGFAKDQHPIETLASHRANQTLYIGICHGDLGEIG
jgi:hypothetical protein